MDPNYDEERARESERARLAFNAEMARRPHDEVDPFNVKHLTCYFWESQGHCKWGRACRYAHWTTGQIARAPVVRDNGQFQVPLYDNVALNSRD